MVPGSSCAGSASGYPSSRKLNCEIVEDLERVHPDFERPSFVPEHRAAPADDVEERAGGETTLQGQPRCRRARIAASTASCARGHAAAAPMTANSPMTARRIDVLSGSLSSLLAEIESRTGSIEWSSVDGTATHRSRSHASHDATGVRTRVRPTLHIVCCACYGPNRFRSRGRRPPSFLATGVGLP